MLATLSLLLAAVLVHEAAGWTVEILARDRFCFYQEVTDSDVTGSMNNLTMSFYFRVVSGGPYNKITFNMKHYYEQMQS